MEALLEIDQIDVAPTLSVLLGVPIPMNSLGYIIEPTLDLFNIKQALHMLHYNAHQLLQILMKNVPSYLNGNKQGISKKKYLNISNSNLPTKSEDDILD